jgi:hypothetical protein
MASSRFAVSAMRLVGAIVLAICLCGLFAPPALAEKRVALLIGDSNYQNVSHLANPTKDAAMLAEVFKKGGFDLVDLRADLKATEMRRALRDFSDKARDADIAVVYYAGHGIEVDGINYLIPVDAVLERDIDIYDEAFPLDRLMITIEPAKQLRLIILDACRDNPFAKTMKRTIAQRAVGQGLAKVDPTSPNTLIAFAARAGFTAFDGDGGKGSPYAVALADHLTTPGLDLRKAFGFVRDDVLKATNNRQEPFIYGSLGGDDMALVPAPVVVAPPPDPNEPIRRDYEFAERIGTIEAWDFFLGTYPDGYYSKLAQAQRNKLAAEQARLAATEKARAASEEKARLAAEGAKAAEQAKAAADAKAADQARLAAEKKMAEEASKLAAAQRAAAAAEEARLAAEKQRKIEEDKAAAARLARIEEEAKTAAAKAAAAEEARAVQEARTAALQKALEDARLAEAKAAETKTDPGTADTKSIGPVAALPPSGAPPKPSSEELPRLLQAELRRLGCYTGSIDGSWTEPTRRSLSLFNKSAGTTLDTTVVTLDTLGVLQRKNERVCPLICEHGYKADGDTCTRIACKAGYELDDDGNCQRIKDKKPAAKRTPEEQPATRRALTAPSEPSFGGAGGGGGGRCQATSCSAAFNACMRLARAYGRMGYGCQGRYAACVQSGTWDGKFCQMSGLSRR